MWLTPEVRVGAAALWQLMWPVTLTNVMFMLIGVVDLAFIGAVGNTTDLAAGGLAIAYTGVFGVSIGTGLATAMDTLCAQAYGAKNMDKVGRVFQCGTCVCVCARVHVCTCARVTV